MYTPMLCDRETDSEGIWSQQEYHTYGSNKIERLIWRIK
jgi:hypothetical protein